MHSGLGSHWQQRLLWAVKVTLVLIVQWTMHRHTHLLQSDINIRFYRNYWWPNMHIDNFIYWLCSQVLKALLACKLTSLPCSPTVTILTHCNHFSHRSPQLSKQHGFMLIIDKSCKHSQPAINLPSTTESLFQHVFLSKVWSSFMEKNGSAYCFQFRAHPQSSCQVKHANQEILNLKQTFVFNLYEWSWLLHRPWMPKTQ